MKKQETSKLLHDSWVTWVVSAIIHSRRSQIDEYFGDGHTQLSTHARCWWVYKHHFFLAYCKQVLVSCCRITWLLVETSETARCYKWFLTLAHLMSVGGKWSWSKWGQSAWPWPWMFQAGVFSDKSGTHGYLPMVERVSSSIGGFSSKPYYMIYTFDYQRVPQKLMVCESKPPPPVAGVQGESLGFGPISPAREKPGNQLAVGGTVVNWCV